MEGTVYSRWFPDDRLQILVKELSYLLMTRHSDSGRIGLFSHDFAGRNPIPLRKLGGKILQGTVIEQSGDLFDGINLMHEQISGFFHFPVEEIFHGGFLETALEFSGQGRAAVSGSVTQFRQRQIPG